MWRLPLVAALFLGAAAAQIVVTPALVSAQTGTDLYCAAKPSTGQVQVYCYTTVTKPWDTLRFNSIFPMGDGQTAVVPDVVKFDAAGKIKASITWIFKSVSGKVSWDVALNGTEQMGTF